MAAPEKKHEGWRFKLYQLDAEGQWDDRGTGYVCIKNDERLGGPSFHAVGEADNQTLLGCRIVNEDIYQKQGENIITWTEPANHGKEAHDLALSFQEEQGCREIWEKLSDVQGRYMSDYRAFEPSLDTGAFDGNQDEGKSLPEPSIQNLKEILLMITTVNAILRDRYVRTLLDKDAEYLRKLMDIFVDCEDMEDTESLKVLAKLLKNIVLLNDLHLSETLLKKDMFLKLAAAMEYDPELKQRANYRHFLTQEVKFRQVIPFEDPKLVEKIEQNFFLTLLRDHMLRPTMEETNLTSLGSLNFFNGTFILDRIFRESDYLQRVFAALRTVEEREKREDIWRFLRELVALSKTTQPGNQAAFFKYLAEECRFCECFVPVLSDRAASVCERMCCVEILQTFLNHDAYHMRAYVIESSNHPAKPQADPAQHDQSQETSLLYWILRRLATDPDTGVLTHLYECMHMLLDPETMDNTDKDRFLGIFYDHYMVWLVEPLTHIHYDKPGKAPAASGGEEVDETSQNATRNHVCDLVTFCVKFHAYRMRYYIILNNLASKILKLTHAPKKFLRLAAIRFVRAVVGMKDDFYTRHLIKNHLFGPLLTLFEENGVTRTNLIHSAIIELFEFIRAENVKAVIEDLMENHREQLTKVADVAPTFQGLITKYEQNTESGGDRDGVATESVGKVRKRVVDEDDDTYFNEDDDEEDTENKVPMDVSSPSNPPARHSSSSPPPPPLKLVDYDDDEDDDMDPFWSGKGKSAAAAAHRASAGGKPPGSSNGGGISFALGERRPASPSGTAAGTTLNGRAEQQQSSPQQPSVKKVKLGEGSGSP